MCGQGALRRYHHSALGDIKFCRRCDTCSARSTKRAVKVSARPALRRCAGYQPARRPFTAVPKDPTKTLSPEHLRAAHRSTSTRRGSRRIGGTGAVFHHLSFISVQYSSTAALQCSCSCAEARQFSCVASACCGVLCSLHHSVVQQHP